MNNRRIEEILLSVEESIRQFLPVDYFYVMLYDPDRDTVQFVEPISSVAEANPLLHTRELNTRMLPDALLGSLIPKSFSGDRTAFYEQLKKEGLTYWPDIAPPLAWLGVPMKVESRVVGVLVIENHHEIEAFAQFDSVNFDTIARQTAAMIENTQLHDRLNRKIANLRILNTIEQRLRESEQLGEAEIIALIDEQISTLMDTNNMHIIVFDATTNTTRFPLIRINNEVQKTSAHPDAYRWMECAIQNRQPVLIKTKNEYRFWYQRLEDVGFTSDPLASWIGAPMISNNHVIGMIAVYYETVDHFYNEDDLEILQIIAGQTAMALENRQLFKELLSCTEDLSKAQTRVAESEELMVRTGITADFIHRINNLVGTIPIWLDQIRETLEKQGVMSSKLHTYIEAIDSDVDSLLRAAENLKETPQVHPVNLGQILHSLVSQVRIQTPSSLNVEITEEEGPFWTNAIESELAHVFWNIIANGLDAMPDGGNLFIVMQHRKIENQPQVEIQIIDEGKGIDPEAKEHIFSP